MTNKCNLCIYHTGNLCDVCEIISIFQLQSCLVSLLKTSVYVQVVPFSAVLTENVTPHSIYSPFNVHSQQSWFSRFSSKRPTWDRRIDRISDCFCNLHFMNTDRINTIDFHHVIFAFVPGGLWAPCHRSDQQWIIIQCFDVRSETFWDFLWDLIKVATEVNNWKWTQLRGDTEYEVEWTQGHFSWKKLKDGLIGAANTPAFLKIILLLCPNWISVNGGSLISVTLVQSERKNIFG